MEIILVSQVLEFLQYAFYELQIIQHDSISKTFNGTYLYLTFYAPNFEEVAGAYWFGPVRPSVLP